MGNKTIQMHWNQLVTQSTTDAFQPITAWMAAKDIADARVKWEIASLEGDGTTTVTPGYQPANFADSPGAPASIGDAQTTKAVFYPTRLTTRA